LKLNYIILAVTLLLLTSPLALKVIGDNEEKTRAPTTWTILSYMSGDSNLESDMIGDLNEMEKVGSSADVNMIVQLDRREGWDSSNGDWQDTRRYLVQQDDTENIASLRLDDPELGEKNMNDPWTLKEFLVWGFTNYPADHYMITMHGHASGPALGLMDDDSSTLGGSNRMSTEGMGWAIRSAIDETIDRPVDIISLDVCWMGMMEASIEVMNHSNYFFSSFDLIPAAGWPYEKCIPHIIDDSKPMEDRLTDVIDVFYDEYSARWSYISLFALDQSAVRDELVPAFKTFSDEMFYTIYNKRALYDSLLESVDKPSNKDGRIYNDRYIELYQFSQYLSQDVRVPEMVRSAARDIMDTEDSVIVHRKGAANHPADSRLMGLYFPVNMDDPDYAQMQIGKITAWDDVARLYIREIDARPDAPNWSIEKPNDMDFTLKTATPHLISSVSVEIIAGSSGMNLTLIGTGGLFSGVYVPGEEFEFRYRYRVSSIYGGIVDFPPDGYSYVQFSTESEPPKVWHDPPSVVNMGLTYGGLTFYIKDNTGIETSIPEGMPRIEYREKGKSSFYSKPLIERKKDEFTGWSEYWETPSGMTPGARIEYRVVVQDVLGNSRTYPEIGFWETTMGVGARFYLDELYSDISNHGQFVDEFSELGMVVDIGLEDNGIDNLSSYKGYILMMPDKMMAQNRVEIILDFIRSGGEFLLILDPNNEIQTAAVTLLMQELEISVTGEGSVNGFYPINTGSELGSGLPTITGTASGSFQLSEGQTVAYYTEPPYASMFTDWLGHGKIVVTVPDILDDDVMDREANRQLSHRVIGYIHENMIPVIDVSVTPDSVVTPGSNVRFDLSGSYDRDGEVVQYSISMSDSTYMEGADPVFNHVFLETGVFTIIIKAYDEEGEVGSKTITLRINRPPTTDMGISTSKIYAGEQVTFTYKGRDPDGDDLIVEWDFGDGFKVAGLQVHHTYNRRGDFTFTLTVRDIWGLEAVKTGPISVLNSDPFALIDKDNILVNNGPANFSGELMVTLYVKEGDTVRIPGDLSYDPDQNDMLNFTWNMGDGELLHEQIITYIFKNSGLIRINLTVDDGSGGVDSIDLPVNVENKAPFAAFKFKEDGGKVILDASLTTDDPWDMNGLEYQWDFGDGKDEITSSPTIEHDYTFGGKYTVKLTVVDGDGAKSTFEQEISASGISLQVVIALIVSIIVILVVIGAVGWRRLKERMVREEKGLLEILGLQKTIPDEEERERHLRRQPGHPERRPPPRRRVQKMERISHGGREEIKALPPSPIKPRRRGGDD
jgi:PKD repeat protein